MKIYTRKGDGGTTQLYSGERVSKDDPRVAAYGTVDEATSMIGLLRSEISYEHAWQEPLHEVQTNLMNLMAHLATAPEAKRRPKVALPEPGSVEAWIDALMDRCAAGTASFLVPGQSKVEALCHVVRTILRRAEREIVSLHREAPVEEGILLYVNRLSDLFYALGRVAVEEAGLEEDRWKAFEYRP
ncbi:MAG: cob(I)yrinic acid a,c-diamide adenosyltransferase [Puniceicoccaceae bacterium]